jgi:hypothetical protein
VVVSNSAGASRSETRRGREILVAAPRPATLRSANPDGPPALCFATLPNEIELDAVPLVPDRVVPQSTLRDHHHRALGRDGLLFELELSPHTFAPQLRRASTRDRSVRHRDRARRLRRAFGGRFVRRYLRVRISRIRRPERAAPDERTEAESCVPRDFHRDSTIAPRKRFQTVVRVENQPGRGKATTVLRFRPFDLAA